MREQPPPAWYLRWLYELLLSVYYVLMFMWTGAFYNFVGRIGRLLNGGVNTSDGFIAKIGVAQASRTISGGSDLRC